MKIILSIGGSFIDENIFQKVDMGSELEFFLPSLAIHFISLKLMHSMVSCLLITDDINLILLPISGTKSG